LCGRFTLTTDLRTMKDVFQLKENIFDYTPRYNIAPAQNVHVVVREVGAQKMTLMKWGLMGCFPVNY
jgi:putative SOS response-associated peptidase YedK